MNFHVVNRWGGGGGRGTFNFDFPVAGSLKYT